MAEQAGPEHGRWLLSLRELAQEWVSASTTQTQHNATAQTPAYVDLIFAFGLARLGEADAASEALARARAVLTGPGGDDAHRWLLAAFAYRARQALRGEPLTGPLPNDEVRLLGDMERLRRYVVDRMRKHSRILEPDQRVDPFHPAAALFGGLEQGLATLAQAQDGPEVVRLADRLLDNLSGQPEVAQTRVVQAVLEAAHRTEEEELTRRLLSQALSLCDSLPEAVDDSGAFARARLLETALLVAGELRLAETVLALAGRARSLLQGQAGPRFHGTAGVVRQAIRTFACLRMPEELDQFLQTHKDAVLGGRDVSSLDFRSSPNGLPCLHYLLCLCEGWLLFGWGSLAEPVLEAARALLLRGGLPARSQGELACAYLAAAGLAPVAEARARLEEVFRQLPGIRDTYTTATHFSITQLEVVEAAVLAYTGRVELGLT